MKQFMKKARGRKLMSIMLSLTMIVNMLLGNVFAPVGSTEADAATITPQFRNVMYYGEWSIYAGQKNYTPEKIPGNYITHLNFAFLDVDKDGNVISCDSWADFDNPNVGYSTTSDSVWAGVAPAMVQLRNQYPNMKIGFSVGGWTRSGDFPAVAGNATARKNFAENIARVAHLYGYDFVDIDWEYPTADRDPDPAGNGVTIDKGCKGSEADKHNFTLLLQDLRTALNKYDAIDNKHYELSVAMSASPAMMAKIEYDQVLSIVDFANMMTYDLNGAWSPYTGHQTALFTNEAYDHTNQLDAQFSVDACVKYLYNTYGNDIDASKIVVGIAPYTRGWAGVENDGRDANNPGLFATAQPNSVKAADGTTSGTFAYSDIGSLVSQYGLKEYYDTTAQAAYYYSADSGYFFTCDNARSVTAKAEYVKNQGFKNPFNKPLGGLISWMASLDAASEITKTSHDALFGANNQLAAQTITFPAMQNIDTSVSAADGKYTITVKNNNAVTTDKTQGSLSGGAEANVLYYAERFAGTATYPVYYIKTKDGSTLSGSAWEAGGTIGTKDGYTTVTMTAWPYQLAPGETATLTLSTSGTASVSNIAEIAMTRRVSASGKEFGRTVLYQNGETPVTTASSQTTTSGQEATTATQATTTAQATTATQATTAAQATTAKNEEATTVKNGTGSYPKWSDSGTYAVGDFVVYNDKVYECTFGHTANAWWSPDQAVSLWKERPDLVNIPAEETTGNQGEQPTEQETENNYTPNGLLPKHTVTGYWHNFVNAAGGLKLGDVPNYYDLICVSFTDSTSTPGEASFTLDTSVANGYSDAQFKQDIRDLKAKGQHVIISVGGQNGLININSEAAANTFAQSMIRIIENYGFEGIDIDLEGSAVSGTQYIASALRTLHNHFGDNFIITMAPETAYMNPGGQGFSSYYWNLAISIKDILTTVHTQFYNTGSMNGYNGSVVNVGTGAFPANLSTLYIESGLRPDQVAIGVPCCSQAAGSGQISPQTAANAFTAMVHGTTIDGFTPPKAYPTFRGLMTWSINWDATQGYAWGKAARAAVDAEMGGEQPTQKPTEAPTQKPTEAPTQKPTEAPTQAPTEAPTQAEQPTSHQGNVNTSLKQTLLIGYYHMWDNQGNPFIKLRDVDSNWDVINISFATPVNVGSTDGKMFLDTSVFNSNYTVNDFKQDIKALQAQGKKIVLSIGGYEGVMSLVDDAGVNQFVNDINSIVSEYGFDGIDIDLEQYSVEFNGNGQDPDLHNPASPKISYMIKAIRNIMNSHNDKFILSWAPETFYVQKGFEVYAGNDRWGGKDNRCGDYLPMIDALRDVTSYVHVQLYNSGPIMGLDKQYYNMGTVEGIVAMEKMLLEGFYVGSANNASVIGEQSWFAPLRPDQIVIGVPCSAGAAGSGQISNAQLQQAFTQLNNEYPGIRGIMTWSINWDSVQNNNSFARENEAFLAQFRTQEPIEEPETYTVTINGTVVATLEEGATYTLPTDSKIGYYGDGKLYKPGSTYTVNKDVAFSSVKFAAAKTPGLRYTNPAGLSYQGKISCSDAGVFDNAITETGVLAVTNDRLGNGAELTLDSKIGYVNLKVTSWLNNVAGSFSTSFEGIKENNYERDFVLRGYMIVNYADGSKATIYTAMTNPVSVSELAYKVFKNKTQYNSLSNQYKEMILEFMGV